MLGSFKELQHYRCLVICHPRFTGFVCLTWPSLRSILHILIQYRLPHIWQKQNLGKLFFSLRHSYHSDMFCFNKMLFKTHWSDCKVTSLIGHFVVRNSTCPNRNFRQPWILCSSSLSLSLNTEKNDKCTIQHCIYSSFIIVLNIQLILTIYLQSK